MAFLKQLSLFETETPPVNVVPQDTGDAGKRLEKLLAADLDFAGRDTLYFPHGIHGFPAKFPPQLPRTFIAELTRPGEVVLDPMVGSGTTVVEAVLLGRRAVGVDIDPIALALTQAKTRLVPARTFGEAARGVAMRAGRAVLERESELQDELVHTYDESTRKFLDYWFFPQTQLELVALVREIRNVKNPDLRRLLEVAFSSTIISKSGGVSRARDLAHTRPHLDPDKPYRSAIEAFVKRSERLVRGLASTYVPANLATAIRGDARCLPLASESVDLVVTSPPYASNAIDYMRAHKFSLVWFGLSVDELSSLRAQYIGHDNTSRRDGFIPTPTSTRVLSELSARDPRKRKVLEKFLTEMAQVLREIARVLRPGKAAVVVVGSSVMRGVDTQIGTCLAELGEQSGLRLVGMAQRKIDRDKRMMPARRGEQKSGIEARMHHEEVLGFVRSA